MLHLGDLKQDTIVAVKVVATLINKKPVNFNAEFGTPKAVIAELLLRVNAVVRKLVVIVRQF